MVKEMKDSNNDEMREEYDFSGGVRGKHYKALRKSLDKACEANSEESTNSLIVARLPWREQTIRGIKYPEDYVRSAGRPVSEP